MSDDPADMRHFEILAEKAYSDMYDSRYPADHYADLKDFFALAIAAAQRNGMAEEAARLQKRLAHCKEVYRRQFSTF